MPVPEPPARRRNAWQAFAIVGFPAGMPTAVLAVRNLVPLWRG
jgi:hypothetical protein